MINPTPEIPDNFKLRAVTAELQIKIIFRLMNGGLRIRLEIDDKVWIYVEIGYI
jgi:hypothetical protein